MTSSALRLSLTAIALILAGAGGGCARLTPFGGDCRETMGEDGVTLRFCEMGARLTVELVEPAAQGGAAPPRLIDDPRVLTARIPG